MQDRFARALAIAHADARAYQGRLNEVVGNDWSDDYELLEGGAVVLCRLTVAGVTRSDIGEASPDDRNTATSAVAQAFKRAAVKFGIGRYLYDLPKTWVEYDRQRKRFTEGGPARLEQVLLAIDPRVLHMSYVPKRLAARLGATRRPDRPRKVTERAWIVDKGDLLEHERTAERGRPKKSEEG
jgi:hypothetical protein